VERTLIIVKPEGVQRGLIGQVLSRFESKGFKIVGLKLIHISPELAARHYAEHQGKPFYEGLIKHITSSPVVVGVLEGPNVIGVTRALMGPTKPWEAPAGTIRGDYAVSMGLNIIHGSDGAESAAREIDAFFAPGELLDYPRATDPWIIEG
jgi:nucleoside-diphosphate kinase